MANEYSGGGDLNQSLVLLWRGDQRQARGPKPGLTLEQIVGAAVTVADREGLAALSMRRVAAELGVGAMSLYRYVPGKAELLDLMLDHVNRLSEDDQDRRGGDWRTVLEHYAYDTWQLFHDHPWLLQVNQARPLLGPNTLAGIDLVLSGLGGLALRDREKIALIMTVEHYVTGTARTVILQQQAEEQTGVSDEEFWAGQEPLLDEAMSTGQYPELSRLDSDAFSMSGIEVLEFGLGPLLDGLAARIECHATNDG